MTPPLVAALHALDLEGEVSLAGRWVKLRGERCAVYVVEGSDHGGYYTWCDDPQERVVQAYRDPVEAIRAGLDRAARRQPSGRDVD
jgi:hypothetical protein